MPGRNSGEKKPRCRGVRYLNTFQRISKKVCMAIISKISQSVQSTLKSSSRPTAAGGLGILTKYVAKQFENTNRETGEIFKIEKQRQKDGSLKDVFAYSQDVLDLERGLLKKQARRILMKLEDRQKRLRIPYSFLVPLPNLQLMHDKLVFHSIKYKVEDMPNEKKRSAIFRVVNCGRDKIKFDQPVEIWQSSKSERCAFHKTQQCGSVWTCPTCSPKINMERQKDIQNSYNAFATQKVFDSMMVTLTIKHGFSDALKVTLSQMKEAFRLLQQTQTYKKISGYSSTKQVNKIKTKKIVKSTLDFAGRICSTEITYGANGWHPHMHQLWFFDRKLSDQEIEQLRADLFKEWEKACLSVGLPAPLEFLKDRAIGVDVRRALSAAQYLAKFGSERHWGPEKEMASSHSKKAKFSGRTPFQILFDSLNGDEKSSDLFLDYSYATLGKHQLEFSSGLKKRLEKLGVDLDRTDEDIVQSLEDDSVKMGVLNDNEFEALVKLPDSYPIEPFATVLMICKLSGFVQAIRFIHSLPTFRLRLSPS